MKKTQHIKIPAKISSVLLPQFKDNKYVFFEADDVGLQVSLTNDTDFVKTNIFYTSWKLSPELKKRADIDFNQFTLSIIKSMLSMHEATF